MDDTKPTNDAQEPQDPRLTNMVRWFQEHPEEIPEKFRNTDNPAQALAASYVELERKLSSGQTTEDEETEEEPEVTPETKINRETLELGEPQVEESTDTRNFEWATKEIASIGGKASEQVVSFLKQKHNFTPEMVAMLENSVAQQRKSVIDRAMSVIGGQENLSRLNQWLSKNRSKDEIARINKVINQPGEEAELVLRGLLDLAGINKPQPSNPKSPTKGIQVSNLTTSGVEPYKNFSDVAKAIRSKQYTQSTHPDHNRAVAEHQARIKATLDAGFGNVLTGS